MYMKKAVKVLFCVLLTVSMFAGCVVAPGDITGSTAPSKPTTDEILQNIHKLGTSPDDNHRVWYEIFVYSFCDSNGDGIGDLQGVISKLDYLQQLGITGIWFMPIHPSTSYHKYNVTDYYSIDPAYGTMADFEQLLRECQQRGIKVIIAGAGMAAHLPGMCAAIFPLPVIGIPMHTTSLGGRDSLYSIVQMPSGIPVATVAIGGGANAAILACKILAVSDDELLAKLKAYSENMKQGVMAKDSKLQETGYKNYTK
jgi:5-(carboxyamino)imidazole ribonucleotide mutase